MDIHARTLAFFKCTALLLAGCVDEASEPHNQIREYHTAEPICVSSLGADPGERSVEVTVLFDECIVSCTDSVESSCSIEREGGTLHIEVFARTRFEFMPVRACASVCRRLEATCQSTPLPPGDYTVVQGEFSRAIALPSEIPEGASCCFDHPCADDE